MILFLKKITSIPSRLIQVISQESSTKSARLAVSEEHPIFQAPYFLNNSSEVVDIKDITLPVFELLLEVYQHYPKPFPALPIEVAFYQQHFEIDLKLGEKKYHVFNEENFALFYKAIQLISGPESKQRLNYFNMVAKFRSHHPVLKHYASTPDAIG
jgi:hypothetical protein